MPAAQDFIFGYGSLLPRSGHGGERAIACRLEGFRRGWNVAMDNAVTIPGYKYYVDANTRERPAVHVTFLNIWPRSGSRVNGVAYPVDEETLPLLDVRERNYDRRDVTAHIDAGLAGRVWAYMGRGEARERYETGLTRGTAVVSERYVDGVRDRFALVEPGMLEEFDRTTEPLQVPRRALERIDVLDNRDGAGSGRPRHWAVEGIV